MISGQETDGPTCIIVKVCKDDVVDLALMLFWSYPSFSSEMGTGLAQAV
jgi:hypothetical protein